MNIKWNRTGNDKADLIARPVPGEILRIEQLDKDIFWWAVYIGDKMYDCREYGHAVRTLRRAKSNCERLYKKLKDATNNS